MAKVGVAYKKITELRRGISSDIDANSMVIIADPITTEDFTLTKPQFRTAFDIFDLNPTNGFVPYRGSDIFKDSPVQFDEALNILISSIPAVVPQIVIETSVSIDIEACVDTVFATGNINLNMKDRTTSGIPLSIRNLSGTTTLTADVGTLEQTTITTNNSVKFIQIANGDWKAVA